MTWIVGLSDALNIDRETRPSDYCPHPACIDVEHRIADFSTIGCELPSGQRIHMECYGITLDSMSTDDMALVCAKAAFHRHSHEDSWGVQVIYDHSLGHIVKAVKAAL